MKNQNQNLQKRTMINHVIKVNDGEYYFVMPEYYPLKPGYTFYEDREKCVVVSYNGKL